MTEPRIGDIVHYTAGIADIGAPTHADGYPDARCQAAIIVHIGRPGTALLSVYGDVGWEDQPGVPAEPGHSWQDFTPGTWHPVH